MSSPFNLRFNYSADTARRDLVAGATVAAIAIPQAMAYALIAGVDPRFGLYSAIVVTLVASIFDSSSHLINGPTNAISLVVFSSLVGFDVRFDAAKAGESGHSVLVPPVGTVAQSGPYNLLAVGLGTLLATL